MSDRPSKALLERLGYIADEDFAEMIGVTVRALKSRPINQLPTYSKIGRRWLFQAASVRAYMASTSNGDLDDGGSDDELEEWAMPPGEAPDNVGWIYCIQGGPGAPVKIGFARDVPSRLASLQTASPNPLAVLAKARGTIADEGIAHAALSSHRRLGEWFEWRDPVERFVEALQAGGTVQAALDAAGTSE